MLGGTGLAFLEQHGIRLSERPMSLSGVRPYVRPGVATVTPETSLREAVRRLEVSGAGVVAVVDRNRLIGALTTQDMELSVPLLDGGTTEVRVSELLPADLSYCFEDTQVDEAVRLMRDSHLDRLLVLDRNGQVIGTVTLATVSQDPAD